MSVPVHVERRDENDPERLRARTAQLDALLRERAAHLDATKADLEAFRVSYQREVGVLDRQLVELEDAIAEAELAELSRRLDAAGDDTQASSSTAPTPEPAPRFTSDAVRKLFRDVAKLFHPDLARDEIARDRHHALMVEANRAYVLGDEAQLRWLLEAWEPNAPPRHDEAAVRQQLVRRISHLEEQLVRLDNELSAIKATPLWELKTMVEAAAARGRDIVRDMVERLTREIMVATNRLEAMRPPS